MGEQSQGCKPMQKTQVHVRIDVGLHALCSAQELLQSRNYKKYKYSISASLGEIINDFTKCISFEKS